MNMKNKLYIACIFAVLFISMSCSKNKAYQSLMNVPENQKAWIPEFLRDNEEISKQVYNYYECHDLDTNETWGYFSIDVQLFIPKSDNKLNDHIFVNKKKLEKKIIKLGCSEQINKGQFFRYENSAYFLIFDEAKHKFYFFGKYK